MKKYEAKNVKNRRSQDFRGGGELCLRRRSHRLQYAGFPRKLTTHALHRPIKMSYCRTRIFSVLALPLASPMLGGGLGSLLRNFFELLMSSRSGIFVAYGVF